MHESIGGGCLAVLLIPSAFLVLAAGLRTCPLAISFVTPPLTASTTSHRCGVNRAFRDFVPPMLLLRGPGLDGAAIDALNVAIFVVDRR
jgi:hypothetical protein